MLEISPGLLDLGPEGLLALVVVLVLTGNLASGKEVRYWRQAFFSEQEMRRDLQNTGYVTRSVLQAIPEPEPEQLEEPE